MPTYTHVCIQAYIISEFSILRISGFLEVCPYFPYFYELQQLRNSRNIEKHMF